MAIGTVCVPVIPLTHLVDLYQPSFKKKGFETNFIDQAKPMDIYDPVFDLSSLLNTTHLDVSDFIVERVNEVYRYDLFIFMLNVLLFYYMNLSYKAYVSIK